MTTCSSCGAKVADDNGGICPRCGDLIDLLRRLARRRRRS